TTLRCFGIVATCSLAIAACASGATGAPASLDKTGISAALANIFNLDQGPPTVAEVVDGYAHVLNMIDRALPSQDRVSTCLRLGAAGQITCAAPAGGATDAAASSVATLTDACTVAAKCLFDQAKAEFKAARRLTLVDIQPTFGPVFAKEQLL